MTESKKTIIKELLLALLVTIILETILHFLNIISFREFIGGVRTFLDLPEIWETIPPNVKLITFLLLAGIFALTLKVVIDYLKEKNSKTIAPEEFNKLKLELDSKKQLLEILGIVGLTERKDKPITSVSESITKSYDWVGLSAINELGPGAADNTEILEDKLDNNIKLSYTIISPEDKLRIKQSAIWEGHDPSAIRKHIELSVDKLMYLKKRNEHQVNYFLANRIPWLRVTKIDKNNFQVAHYDKFAMHSEETSVLGYGCGFTGSILLVSNDSGKEPLLFTWLDDFMLIEKQNAIIEDLYAAVSREYCSNKDKSKIIDNLQSEKYKELNNNFNMFFKWHSKNPQLRKDDITLAIEYLEKRYGLSNISRK